MFYSALLRILRTVHKAADGLEVTGEAEFFLQSSFAGCFRRFLFHRVAAAAIGPDQWPEHFLATALLDQDFLAEVAKDIHGECAVQLAFAAVCRDNLFRADGIVFLIDEDDGAHGESIEKREKR